jgi:hypothetical protein
MGFNVEVIFVALVAMRHSLIQIKAVAHDNLQDIGKTTKIVI